MRRLLLFSLIPFITAMGYAYNTEEIITIMRDLSPVVDIANTPDSIYQQAAVTTVVACEEMPWGKNVPEREFRHFVVPLRVNNEPLDNHRPIIYGELKDRVKNMSMKDAILEVNHWCHEYVVYQPSDGRTHSPLQSMSTLKGRCGEESVLTVAALRSVGIPARQVYTPRWAHTDDNHAWVEAWADGQWYFLGACEPEAVLNLAWFNAPATRGMLMNTFARGEYDGPEEVVSKNSEGVNINVTSNYAPTVCSTIKVVDKDGNPVEGAKAAFRLYNYAEFYPLTTMVTNQDGIASFTSGLGDMFLSVTDGEKTVWKPISATANEIIEVCIDDATPEIMDFILTPPVPGQNIVTAPEDLKAINDARLAQEDVMRNKKAERFISEAQAKADANKLGLPAEDWAKAMKLARGNGEQLTAYMQNLPAEKRPLAMKILATISEKDYSDILPSIIDDQLLGEEFASLPMAEFILAPRIALEFLSPWRETLANELSDIAVECRQNPEKWAKAVQERINIIPDWIPATIIMNPEEAWLSGSTNAKSRDVLFVAGARSMGIPSRINPITANVEWADAKGDWHKVNFGAIEANASPKGSLQLIIPEGNVVKDPGYYRHFSIVKVEGGNTRQLEFDEDATYTSDFQQPVELDCGVYMLVTGQRLANGSVLAHIQQFAINENRVTEIPLVIRHDDSEIEVLGNFNSEDLYYDNNDAAAKSILSTTGRGYYVLGILQPKQEPSNHTMRDIAAVAAELENTGIPFVLLSEQTGPEWIAELNLEKLPANLHWGKDIDNSIKKEIIQNMDLGDNCEMPIFIIADTFNRIVFITSGYSIGLGQQLLNIINKL